MRAFHQLWMPRRRVKHHARHSGYDLLVEELDAAPGPAPGRIMGGVAGRLWNWGGKDARHPLHYGYEDYRAECGLLEAFLRGARGLVHFPYGEDQVWLLPRIPRPRECVVVASYHQPASVLDRCLPCTKHIQGLDGVVIVAESQRSWFRQHLPEEKIHLVRHGIDTEFFRPAEKTRAPFQGGVVKAVCVGSWLRDFDLLDAVLESWDAADRELPLDLHCIGNAFRPSRERPGVRWRVSRGLSDEELRAAYQEADLLLLPLQESTANNALLEGMACGLPPLISDVGGGREYLGPELAECAVGSADAFAQRLREWVENPRRFEELSAAARRAALALEWGRVGLAVREVHEKILSGRG